jgi:hypothetical protein
MNKLKKNSKTINKKSRAGRFSIKTKKRFIRVFRALNLLGYIEIRTALRSLPFALFWSALALLYIANSFYSEKIIRDTDGTSREIRELQSEYITTKSELMIRSGQSQVAEAVALLELEESREAPVKLTRTTEPKPQP